MHCLPPSTLHLCLTEMMLVRGTGTTSGCGDPGPEHRSAGGLYLAPQFSHHHVRDGKAVFGARPLSMVSAHSLLPQNSSKTKLISADNPTRREKQSSLLQQGIPYRYQNISLLESIINIVHGNYTDHCEFDILHHTCRKWVRYLMPSRTFQLRLSLFCVTDNDGIKTTRRWTHEIRFAAHALSQ
jgi:hypothetical protein